ncbi:MAG: T9SS type A sorting domain-containing protein, partial [Bacteroidales bacterium]|nr:T9SS type A sorting domain-containing protein [Bacteroidales bacterium]
VRNTLFVKTNAPVQKLEMMDLLGKTMMVEESVESVDMSQFRAGIYLIRITTDQGTVTQKVIKQ